MKLQQLRYLVAIVDCGSFNRASQTLYVTQPTMSKAIEDLEREMGITILARTNRGVTLTEEGTRFLSYARQVVEQADLLEEQYKGGTPTGDKDLIGMIDAGDVAGYAMDAVRWAYGNGLVQGMTATTLAPKNNTTRAQFANILLRYVENVSK